MYRSVLSSVVLVFAAVLLASSSSATSPPSHPHPPASAITAPPPTGGTKDAKLDSQLASVQSVAETKNVDAALAAARHGGVAVHGKRVVVVVEAADVANATSAVAREGGQVEVTAGKLVQAAVPPGRLRALARSDGVKYVRPPLPHAIDAVPDEAVRAGVSNAQVWQSLGRTGTGAAVAIVDMGFTNYTAAQASGDLPASVVTQSYCADGIDGSTDHGTAVAEVVHKMAPDAQLYLVCVESEVGLAQAESYVASHGVQIVNHSVAWFNSGRGDGTGVPGSPDATVAQARADGILWVNAAGNYQKRHWKGAFTSAPWNNGWATFAANGDQHEWFWMPAGNGGCAVLKWDQWPVSSQDYDLYVGVDGLGGWVAASTDLQNGSQEPSEGTCWTNTLGYDAWFFVAIHRFAATASPRLDLFVYGSTGTLQYQVPAGSIIEPASSPNAFAAGAVCWQSGGLESYSSEGPTVDNRVKPDIAGQDSVSSLTYGTFTSCGNSGFTGTSAAAPHVAGAAALVEQIHPAWTPAQVQAYLTGMAVDAGAAGRDNLYGAGRLFLGTAGPTVAAVAPLAGPVGTTVTLTGTRLVGATGVRFNGVETAPTSVTATTVKAVVPLGASTGKIQVVAPEGNATTTAVFKVTPKITGFSPGLAARGESITIEGSAFTGVTAVKFGLVPASFGFVDDGHVTATVPSTAVSSKVTLTTASGSVVSASTFVVVMPPTVSGFTPLAGPVGATVTVNGAHLDAVTTVSLNGTAATPAKHVGTTQLTFVVPVGASTGPITVTSAAGTSGPTTASFKVTPKVTGFNPGMAARGDSVTIQGYNFTGVQAVKFGTLAASFAFVDDNTVTATVPAAAVSAKVTVTTAAGSGTSAAIFPVVLPPTVSSFSPLAGPVGAKVTVTGTHLDSVTSATLGGVDVGTVGHVGTTQVTFTVPAGASTGLIAVTNAAGTKGTAAAFKVTPKVTGITPASAARGDSVTIEGYNFTGVNGVKFGLVAASFAFVDDNHVTATVPPTAVTAKVTVTTAVGAGTSAASFTVVVGPKVSAFSPTSGATGVTVTITGAALGGTTDVLFNGLHSPKVTQVSTTQVKAVVPNGATTGKVTVVADGGTTVSVSNFTVTFSITGISPGSGPAGTQVTITGIGLGQAVNTIKVGDALTGWVSRSPTQIVFVIPSFAVTGPIVLTNGTVSITSPDVFTVT